MNKTDKNKRSRKGILQKIKKGTFIFCLSAAAICFFFGIYFSAQADSGAKENLFHYKVSVEQFNKDQKNNSRKIEYVLFFKPTCPTCHKAAPLIESVVREKGVHFSEVDVTGEEELIKVYDLVEVPTLVKLVDGKEVDRIVGISDNYEEFITNELGEK